MAVQGSKSVVVTDFYTLVFEWYRSIHYAFNNKSEIKWTLKVVAASSGISTFPGKTFTAKVNGETTSGGAAITMYPGDSPRTLYSGTTAVIHELKDEASFPFEISLLLTTGSTIKLSGTGVIPGAATITCSTVNIGSAPTIRINGSDAYTYTITYDFGSQSDTIATKTSSRTISNYTWPNTFMAEIPNAQYGVGVMTCETYEDYTLVGSHAIDFRANVSTYYKPIIAPVIKDTNSTTIALTGDSNKLIRYKSTANVTINAASPAGSYATITSQKAKNGTNYFTTATGNFGNVSSGTFTFEATDSRGFTTTVSRNLSMASRFIEYILPTCFLEPSKPDGNGEMSLKGTGVWFNESFGAKSNTLQVQYRYKQEGGSYGSWTSMSVSITGNDYTATASVTVPSYQNTYIFQVRAVDALSTTVSAEYQVLSKPIFHWGESDFAFEVPVSIQGETIQDFIVEQGTEAMGSNGTWYWSKWASGRAECYGLRNYGNMAVTTTWGNLYRSEIFTQSLPYGVFEEGPEYIGITLRAGSYGGWVVTHEQTQASSTSTNSFIIVRPASATISQAYLGFYCVGRWK